MQAPRHLNTLHMYGVLFVLLVNEGHNDCKGQESETVAPLQQTGVKSQQDWDPSKDSTKIQERKGLSQSVIGETIASWDPGIISKMTPLRIDSTHYSGNANDNQIKRDMDTFSENDSISHGSLGGEETSINSKNDVSDTNKDISNVQIQNGKSDWTPDTRERRSIYSQRQVSDLPGGLILWSSKTGGESNPSHSKQDYHSMWSSSSAGVNNPSFSRTAGINSPSLSRQDRDQQVKDNKMGGMRRMNEEERFMLGVFNCFENRTCRHPKADKVRSIQNLAPIPHGKLYFHIFDDSIVFQIVVRDKRLKFDYPIFILGLWDCFILSTVLKKRNFRPRNR